MKRTNDTTQTARASTPDPTCRATRRDVIVTGGTGVSLLAATGISSASNHETSSKDARALESDPITATVTGLETDGPLEGCVVEYENERTTSDESGTVVFENGEGPYEVTLQKEGWFDKTETIETEGDQQERYIPMYADNSLDD